MVSNAPNTSQNHITKTTSASRYMVIKTMLQCVHVDEIRENLWGGLLSKRHCDVINERDHKLVLKWWETSTNVSPI
jgi:hypothetical protein